MTSPSSPLYSVKHCWVLKPSKTLGPCGGKPLSEVHEWVFPGMKLWLCLCLSVSCRQQRGRKGRLPPLHLLLQLLLQGGHLPSHSRWQNHLLNTVPLLYVRLHRHIISSHVIYPPEKCYFVYWQRKSRIWIKLGGEEGGLGMTQGSIDSCLYMIRF